MIMFPVMMLSWFVADHFWHGAAAGPVAAGLAAGIATYITDMVLTARFRPQIRRFLSEHEAEIAGTA
jgi:hypothetical protein